MWWAAAFQGVMSLFGASKQRSAGKQAKQVARMNVTAEGIEGREQFRRDKAASEQQVGYARAVAGASGFSVQAGTSQQTYIDALESEDKRQRDFALAGSKRKQTILAAGGQAAYSSAQAGMWGSIGTAVGAFGNAWSTRPGQ